MADKMMRIAGRSEKGFAKAVRSDEEGRLITKSINAVERIEVATELTNTQVVNVPVQFERNFKLIVVNSGSNNASLSITATEISGTSSVWYSARLKSNKEINRTGNEVTINPGTSSFYMTRSDLEKAKTLRITFNGSETSRLNAYVVWVGDYDGELHMPKHQVIPQNATRRIFNAELENHIKLTVVPIGTDSENTLDVSFSKNSLYFNGNVKSSLPLKNVGLNKSRITEKTTFVINDVYTFKSFAIDLHSKGTATATYIIEESDNPFDDSEYFTRLYSTSASIGDGNNFKPNIDSNNIIVCVDVNVSSGGQVESRIFPRNSKLELMGELTEVGDSEIKGNTFIYEMSDTKYYIVKNTSDLYQVNAGATITGNADITVSYKQTKADIVFNDPQKTDDYFENDSLLVNKVGTYKHYASLENWTARVTESDVLQVSDGITLRSVNLADLPGWKTNDAIGTIGFIPYKQGGRDTSGNSREVNMRLCFFTSGGNIYHNYPARDSNDRTVAGGMTDFDLSIIYEPVKRLSDNKVVSSERVPTKDVSADKNIYRYEPGLPEWNYEQHNQSVGGFKANGTPYGSGGLPPITQKNGMQLIKIVHPFEFGTNPHESSRPYRMSGHLGYPFSVKPKATIFTPYNGITASKQVVLSTTDGGRIWVVLHQLGSSAITAKYGNFLDYSSIGSYASGEVSLVKRTYNVPTGADKEPENAFSYNSPISVTNLQTLGGKATVTTSSPHNLVDGDLISFKKNADGNYSFLENDINAENVEGLATNSTGNGRFYSCKVVNNTTFQLLQNYAGVDEKIYVDHIHSSNPVKDGVVIAGGETHPRGWILYVPIHEIDDFESFDMYTYRANHTHITRLTSSEKAAQRAVGFYLTDDQDQTYLHASDDGTVTRSFSIEGRTDVIKRSSSGLFKGKLAEIDDFSMAENILEMDEASLGLIVEQGLYVVIGMSRNTYISSDLKNWVTLPIRSKYVGETTGSVFIRNLSSNDIYRIDRK